MVEVGYLWQKRVVIEVGYLWQKRVVIEVGVPLAEDGCD